MLDNILIAGTIICFAGILVITFYVRWKVFGAYQVLVRNRVEFESAHIFDQALLKEEILPKYPNLQKEILTFTKGIRFSIRAGTALVVCLTLCGGVLMYNR
ncbi:MAG: hypothetical protein GY810_24455 [Aureispira sp.]|nr:hypothetical protein [Aureispira sp.]